MLKMKCCAVLDRPPILQCFDFGDIQPGKLFTCTIVGESSQNDKAATGVLSLETNSGRLPFSPFRSS